MKLTEEAKKDILTCVMDRVAAIADREYQKRVWIRGEGPECDDFDETCCNFFQDGDGIIQNYKDFKIAENQYQILKKFREKFRAFSDENNWPQEFVDSPEWEKITEMANDVLKAFNYQKIR